MNIRISEFPANSIKDADKLFFRVGFWKLIFMLTYTSASYVLAIWSILKNKPLLLLGTSIFFLFEIIQSLNLLFGALFAGLKFLSILYLLGLFFATTGVTVYLTKIIHSLNNLLIDLDLFKKRDSESKERRSQHLFIVIFLTVGFPYLYDLVNNLFSIYGQSGYGFYTNHFIYLFILIIYLIGILLKNRFVYLAFISIIIFAICEFHEFVFHMIFSIINYQTADNQSWLFSFNVMLIYKIFAHVLVFTLSIAAILQLRKYFNLGKVESSTSLDSDSELTN